MLKVKDYELNRELAEQNGSVYSATPPLVMDPENPNAGKGNKIIYLFISDFFFLFKRYFNGSFKTHFWFTSFIFIHPSVLYCVKLACMLQ